jgi:hypothetical protein
MATITAGTAATTTLVGVQFQKSLSAADVAAIANSILDPDVNGSPIYPGAFSLQGLLYIPNRGVLHVKRGDYVVYDPATGWPILLSSQAAAGASWVHT